MLIFKSGKLCEGGVCEGRTGGGRRGRGTVHRAEHDGRSSVMGGAVLAALVCAALRGDVDELAGSGEHMANRIMNTRQSGLVHDDAKVKPEPGPAGYVETTVARLKSLGLPAKCIGGAIIDDIPLDPGTRWCVYKTNGGLFGFAYEEGPKPFGNATTIELTLMEAYDDGTVQQIAA